MIARMTEQERKDKEVFNEALEKAARMTNTEIREFLKRERDTMHWATIKVYQHVVEIRESRNTDLHQ